MNHAQRASALRQIHRAIRKLALTASALTWNAEKEALREIAAAELWIRSAKESIARVPAKKRTPVPEEVRRVRKGSES